MVLFHLKEWAMQETRMNPYMWQYTVTMHPHIHGPLKSPAEGCIFLYKK